MTDWSDEFTVFTASKRLKGLAEKKVKFSADNMHELDDLKKIVNKVFSTQLNYYELLKEMLDRKQTSYETLLQYYFDKLRLLQRFKIFGENAVACIVGGLIDQML